MTAVMACHKHVDCKNEPYAIEKYTLYEA